MRNVNCLFLDQDLKAGLKTILEGIEKVKGGSSMWIFPRNSLQGRGSDRKCWNFKEGSLKIAEKSGCPVVPVAITRNGRDPGKTFSIHSSVPCDD